MVCRSSSECQNMLVEDDTHVIYGQDVLEPLSDKTLGEEILHSLLYKKGENVAMVDAFTGKTLSYKILLEETCNLAGALRAYGCTTDTVVSISSENSVEFIIPVLAALFVGCPVAPLNHNYTQLELEHSMNISKPRIVFCSNEVAPKMLQLKKRLKYLEKVVIIDSIEVPSGAENLKAFVKETLGETIITPHTFQPITGDPSKLGAFIMCSSGTTGLPKGVLLSHRNIMVTVIYLRDPRIYNIAERATLGLMPFFHAYGLSVTLNAIINRRKLVSLRKFDEDIFLKTIQDYRIPALSIAPPLAVFLEKSPKVLKYDLSSLKEILCGAAPLGKDTENGIKKRLKNVKAIRQGYGLTEATLGVTVVERGVHKPGSCGRVMIYTTCKVRDPETGKSLGPYQVGEICVKGPLVMMGYYNNENATRECFTSDGWLRTGDMGYYDDDKYFYIVDRLKELIKYKGFQVAPAELEAILLNHPKVRDVGVVGLPDQLAGELPLAFVVKTEGADVTEKELQQYIAGIVSPQKRLRGGVIFVSDIPKNPTGKILRRELRQQLKNHKALKESKL